MKNPAHPAPSSSKKAKRYMKNPLDPAPSSRGKREVKFTLPDDILNDILSWLPAKDVVRCQCVCRRWRDLISSKEFVDLHTHRGVRCSSPMVLVEEWKKEHYLPVPDKRESLLDKWWVQKGKKSQIHEFHGFLDNITCFSLDGFVVLKSPHSREIIFFNPINRGTVRIVVQENMFGLTYVYGIFFNPTLKEYCALFGYRSYNYKILNLGSKPCWRDIRIPFNHKAPGLRVRPVVIHDYLYYLLGPEDEEEYMYNGHADIMEFDINTEVFKSVHYPVPNTAEGGGFGLDLLNIDGFLSLVFVRISRRSIDINIGTLRDRTEQLWTTSNFRFHLRMSPTSERPRALAAVDEELLIHSDKKLIVCNLKLGTARNLKNYTNGVSFIPHVVGLASLSNCKSRIYLGWEGVDPELRGLW